LNDLQLKVKEEAEVKADAVVDEVKVCGGTIFFG
jgi:hypothetical protein